MSVLDDIVDKIAAPIVAFDADLRLIAANAAYIRMLDLPKELCTPGAAFSDILRYNWRNGLYGNISEEGAVQHWINALRNGMSDAGRIVRPNGSVHVVEKRDLDGGGWVLTYVDLTESSQKQQDLEASEARYLGIIEDQSEMISRFDADCRLTFVNAAYCEAFGFTREELIGKDFTDCIPDPNDRVFMKRAVKALSRDNPSFSGEYLETNADGTACWRHWIDRALFDADGNIIEYQGVGRDITAQRNAEDALRESEARYRGIVEDQTEYITRFDKDFRITFANKAFCEAHDTNVDEIIGVDIVSLIDDPVEQDGFRAMVKSLSKDNPSYTGIYPYIGSDGSTCWELYTDRALFDADGNIVEYQGVGRDITEQRQAEEALRENEARYRGIVEDQTEFIMRFDPRDQKITFVNPAYCRQMGRSDRDLLGMTVWDLVDAPTRDALTAKLATLTPDAPYAISESSYINIAGQNVVEQWTDRARFDDAGEIVEYQAVGRDITEQFRAREALSRSERRFKAITETHPVPVFILRRDDHAVLYASPAARTLLDPDGAFETLRGQPLVFEDGAEAGLFETDPNGEIQHRIETRLNTARGAVPVEITARRMEYDGFDAVTIGVTDLSDRLAVEAEMQRQRDALAQSEKMNAMGSLLASVAHELNNPLAVILAQAELACEFATSSDEKARATRIQTAAERCSRIVKTFLAMARQKPPSREAVDLNALVRGAADLVGYALSTAGIKTDLNLTDTLPLVAADPDQLTQVVINLLINAQQAMAEEDGARAISLVSRPMPDGTVELAVTDTGPGVPDALRQRIFEPFFTTKDEGGGTGIGLSVCANIVKGHGGSLRLEHSETGGARFVLTLPVHDGLQSNAPLPALAPLQDLKILAVDDEAEIGISIAEMLIPEGHDVMVAVSASQALEIFTEEPFDLILSDIRMPGMDGLQFFRRLKSDRPALAERIGYITGDTLSGLSRRLIQETGRPVLEKPFSKDELLDFIARLCTQKAAE